MKSRIRNAAVALLMLFQAGCLGGTTGSAPGANPTAAGPGAPNSGDSSGGFPAGGGAGADEGSADGEGGVSYYYAADYDATASSAKPLPGGAVATGGIWEGNQYAALVAKGTLTTCATSSGGTKKRLAGQVLPALRSSLEYQALANGCGAGDYLYAMEFDNDGLVGCNYFPLSADCSFAGYLDFQYSSHLKFYVHHTSVAVTPACESEPVTTLLGQQDYPDSFFVEAKDQVTSARYGTYPACSSLP
ncbi:MAG TPA: hypothetical protein VFX30_03950 [bacterium]|nr:hypothetical protein [bacterium]